MISIRALLAGLALTLAGGGVQAQTAAVLTGDSRLAIVDLAALKVVGTRPVTGTGPLAGIDVRPADGMLYAVAVDGTVATIDPATGKATRRSTLETMVPRGAAVTVDFNPAADRLRVMGADGTNLRANVDDGKVVKDGTLKFAEGDMHKGEKPNVVAGAYVNSVKGAKQTTLYDIDATIGALLRQAPPNDGVLAAVGKLGVKAEHVAFDILSDGQGGERAFLIAGDVLHTVDLASGAAKVVGKVAGLDGHARDIAILPAP